MTKTRACPKCGKTLPDDAPDGICPGCLMLAGLGNPDSPALAVTTPEGGAFVPSPPHEIASLFPQLEVLEILGHGGMGTVYKARQSRLDRLVALKIIRPESASDPAFAERFNREARTLAKLNHASIVGIHDFGDVQTESGVMYYFVMEYVDGPNLRQVVQSGELSTGQAVAVIPQICEALQYAHAEGVVHRDIKPENILIDSKGRVKIADFGLAKLAERSAAEFTLTGTHQVMGTPRYMAPEQMEGSRTVDHRADIYSLGVVFYELLTGELPMGQFEPPSVRAGADVRLDEVVMRALAREPERRFQSAGELKSCVEAISSVSSAAAESSPGVDSNYVAGASTIIEREAAAAWTWLAADPKPGREADSPAPPTMLMLLLSIAGCLSVLLPWVDAEVFDSAEKTNSGNTAECDAADRTWSLTALQVGSGEFDSFGSDTDVVREHRHTFYGLDKWPGIVVCVCFSILALMMLALPSTSRARIRWLLPLIALSVLALVHTLIFKMEVESTRVELPVSSAASTAEAENFAGLPGHSYVLCQDGSFAGGGAFRLKDLQYTLTYRAGFFLSVATSITMLILATTGVRHALTHSSSVTSAGQAAVRHTPVPEHVANVAVALPAAVGMGAPVTPPPAAERGVEGRIEDSSPPRFSRKAIAGAVLIPFGLLFLAGMFLATFTVRAAPQNDAGTVDSAPSWWILLFGVVGGLLAPLLTTVLGMVSIHDIRHSNGRVTGLGLAFLDAALFPSLVADIILIGFLTLIWPDTHPRDELFQLYLFICFVTVLVVNGIILRRIWGSLIVSPQHRETNLQPSHLSGGAVGGTGVPGWVYLIIVLVLLLAGFLLMAMA